MKGIRLALGLFLSSSLLVGCQYQSVKTTTAMKPATMTKRLAKTSSSQNFTEIESNLPVDVQVVTGRPSRFMIMGMSKESSGITAEIAEGRLHLTQTLFMTHKQKRRVHVRVELPQLTTLIHHGSGKLSGNYIKGDYVTIKSTGSGELALSGPMTLQSLIHLGSGQVTLKKIQGNPIMIKSHGSGDLLVEGNRLDLTKLDHNGRGKVMIKGLRTRRLDVVAAGDGSVDLQGLVGLYGLTHHGRGSVTINKVRGEPKLHLAGHGKVILKGAMTLRDPMVYKGADDVIIENVYDPHLDVVASGSGNLTIKGKVGLHRLKHTGSGKVTIGIIDSPEMILSLHGSGDTDLIGSADLRSLTYGGSGKLNLYWVDSDLLKIKGDGTGTVFLAGKAKKLDVNIGGAVHLDLQYLRTQDAFVKTKGRAIAKINTQGLLNTLAVGHSHIYMYKDSNFMAYYNSKKGSNIRVSGLGLCSPDTLCLGGEWLPIPKELKS